MTARRPAAIAAIMLAAAMLAAGSGARGDGGRPAAGPAAETDGSAPGRSPAEVVPPVAPAATDVPITGALAGIPQQGKRLGAADAPVEIAEFGDFLCTYCAQFSRETLPALVERHVRPGAVSISYNPIAFYGEDSERGALGALAAARQGRMWQFVERVLAQQGLAPGTYLTRDFLERTARETGLDVARWRRDFDSDAVAREFGARVDLARQAGVTGTPFYVVRGPAGAFAIPGSLPASEWDRAIEAARSG